MEKALIDSFNRKIDYLRLSVTDRCNLRCIYCMPEKGIHLAKKKELLTYEEILKIVNVLAQLGIRKLRLTGGEPLLRDNILDFISGFSCIEGMERISITTNGVLLNRYLEGLKRSGISGINISVDCLDPEKYGMITRGGDLDRVLEAVEGALEMGFESIKINVVLSSFLEDNDIRDFIRWSMEREMDIRFIEMMPVSELDLVECNSKNISGKMVKESIGFDSIFDIMQEFGDISPLKDARGFGPAVYYRIKGSRGNIGLIQNQKESCFYCNRIRITPLGQLRLCLFSDVGLDLKKSLRSRVSEKKIKDDIIDFIKKKPRDRDTGIIDCRKEDRNKVPDLMNRIGG